MDTVSTQWMTNPFEPRREGDCMYVRGACDTKAGLAAMLYSLRLIKKSGIRPSANILVAATVDEECQFTGVSHLIKCGVHADGALVSEPTELKVVIAHKGCLRWSVT